MPEFVVKPTSWHWIMFVTCAVVVLSNFRAHSKDILSKISNSKDLIESIINSCSHIDQRLLHSRKELQLRRKWLCHFVSLWWRQSICSLPTQSTVKWRLSLLIWSICYFDSESESESDFSVKVKVIFSESEMDFVLNMPAGHMNSLLGGLVDGGGCIVYA